MRWENIPSVINGRKYIRSPETLLGYVCFTDVCYGSEARSPRVIRASMCKEWFIIQRSTKCSRIFLLEFIFHF